MYYLHQFDPAQPDLNYRNREVVKAMQVRSQTDKREWRRVMLLSVPKETGWLGGRAGNHLSFYSRKCHSC